LKKTDQSDDNVVYGRIILKIDFKETECEIMPDSSGSENGGVCVNIYEFFVFYNGRRIP